VLIAGLFHAMHNAIVSSTGPCRRCCFTSV
jgi:hypothetical protein